MKNRKDSRIEFFKSQILYILYCSIVDKRKHLIKRNNEFDNRIPVLYRYVRVNILALIKMTCKKHNIRTNKDNELWFLNQILKEMRIGDDKCIFVYKIGKNLFLDRQLLLLNKQFYRDRLQIEFYNMSKQREIKHPVKKITYREYREMLRYENSWFKK